MAEVGHILGVTLVILIMTEVDNLLEKITDPMTIVVRVAELMVGCF